jgi:PilZ domain
LDIGIPFAHSYGGEFFDRVAGMLEEKERRKNKRLDLKLPVMCHKVGISTNRFFTGTTVDIGPKGALIDINAHGLRQGELVNVEMPIPPTKGLLEYGGRFSTYARILRVYKPKCGSSSKSASIVQTVALEFCESPKLQV